MDWDGLPGSWGKGECNQPAALSNVMESTIVRLPKAADFQRLRTCREHGKIPMGSSVARAMSRVGASHLERHASRYAETGWGRCRRLIHWIGAGLAILASQKSVCASDLNQWQNPQQA